jgi:deazaflavin-dependent oxidoreductase (nitroreductase family)
MSATVEKPSPALPRWLVRTIWVLHRAAYSVTGGRFGLRTPASTRWGMLRLHTVGRRSGKARVAILGYIEAGADFVTAAMNGWADPEPAWWLNLQASPDATVELPGGTRRQVTARAAMGEERARLWAMLVGLGSIAYTDANAALRSRQTAIVVLEPRSDRRADQATTAIASTSIRQPG